MRRVIWEERAARNEALFREANERIADHVDEAGLATAERIAFVCECADLTCTETLDLSLEEYEAVRAHPAQFVVRPGHERLEIERVIAESRRYCVVEKMGAAGQLAAELG